MKENLKKFPYIIKNILIKIGVYRQKVVKNGKFLPYHALVVIGVNSKYQGLGIGTILLSEFENIAKKDKKIMKIILSVNPNNSNAIKSYKKNGWKISDFSEKSINMFKFVT